MKQIFLKIMKKKNFILILTLFSLLFLSLVGVANAEFVKHTIDSSFEEAFSVYAIDIDGDNDIDVLGVAEWDDEIAWWENDGNGVFSKHTIDSSFDGAGAVYAIDVDGDNDIDVLGTAKWDNDIAWWENDGNEVFTKHIIDSNFGTANDVYAIDVDGDNDIDVLGVAFWDNDIAWWENDGNEVFTKHIIDSSFEGAGAVYAIDVDGDNDIDLLGTASLANDIAWWENDGNEVFTKHIIDSSFDGAFSVYAIDVDGDNDIDVLGAAFWPGEIAWWENDGNEVFSKHTIDSSFGGARDVYAIDVDGDNDIDVLGAANSANDIAWWENIPLLSSPCQGHELWGWAWSENIGWISFSCRDTMALGTGINYGVDIDEGNDKLEGYAWSENIGWISFNTTDLAGCPSGTCEASIDVSGGSGALSGWARVLSPVGNKPLSETGGWDGWISLAGANYQVTLDSGLVPSEFENYAWSDNVIGWISFNSSNQGGAIDYAVYTNLSLNEAPTATALNVGTGNYCFSSSPPIFLNWTFEDDDPGDIQASYNIQVDNNSDFSSLEVDDSGLSSETYAPGAGALSFDDTYYWRVDVSDGISSSGWVNGSSFSTDPRWPQPSFDYEQGPLSLDVIFTNETTYCSSCSYGWDFGDSPTYTYPAEDTYDVTLTAQSSVGSCSTTPAVQVIVGPGLGLPDWEEIIPF